MLEFDNIENIKRAVEIPSGISILPEPSLAREIKAGTLVAVRIDGQDPGDRLIRPLAIIHRRHGNLDRAASKFLDLLIHVTVMVDRRQISRARIRRMSRPSRLRDALAEEPDIRRKTGAGRSWIVSSYQNPAHSD